MNHRLKLVTIALAASLAASACGGLKRSGTAVDGPVGNTNVGSGVDADSIGKTAVPVVTAEPAVAKPPVAKKPPAKVKPPVYKPLPPPDPDDGPAPAGSLPFRLLSKNTPKLYVEIDVVGNAEPSPKDLAHFKSVLESVTDKPGGLTFKIDQHLPAPHGGGFTDSEIYGFIRENRAIKQTAEQASVYLIYVPGDRLDAQGTLGFASGDLIVMFPDTMNGVSVFGRDAVEQAVLTHEMGHILSLINIGYKSPRDHADTEDDPAPGGHHSKNKESVMYYAVDTTGIDSVFKGRTSLPNTYDQDDLADLEDVKSGKLVA